MPIRYVTAGDRVPILESRGEDPIFQESLNRSQKRYDTAVVGREAALQEALSRGYLNQQDRDIFEKQARQQFEDVSTKYSGDLSAGYDDVLGAVTNVRTDPYHQANQRLLEEAKVQRELEAKYGPNAYVQQDVLNQRLYDEQGNLQDPSNFKSQVYNLQDFYKTGALHGNELASSVTSGYRTVAPGIMERTIGFQTPEEALQYIDQNPQVITNILNARGVNPEDQKLREEVARGIMENSIGKREKVQDRSYEKDIDKQINEERLKRLRATNTGDKTSPGGLGLDSRVSSKGKEFVPINITYDNIKDFKTNPSNYTGTQKRELRKRDSELRALAIEDYKKDNPGLSESHYNSLYKKNYEDATSNVKNLLKQYGKELSESDLQAIVESGNILQNDKISKKLLAEGKIKKEYVDSALARGSMSTIGTPSGYTIVDKELKKSFSNIRNIASKYNDIESRRSSLEKKVFKPVLTPVYSAKSTTPEADKDLLNTVNSNIKAIVGGDSKLIKRLEEEDFISTGYFSDSDKIKESHIIKVETIPGTGVTDNKLQLTNVDGDVTKIPIVNDDIEREISAITQAPTALGEGNFNELDLEIRQSKTPLTAYDILTEYKSPKDVPEWQQKEYSNINIIPNKEGVLNAWYNNNGVLTHVGSYANARDVHNKLFNSKEINDVLRQIRKGAETPTELKKAVSKEQSNI